MKEKIFIDMDGTLAEFRKAEHLEDLYEKGYFLDLKPLKFLDTANKLISFTNNVFILSAYLHDSKYALEEKKIWLKKYMPELKAESCIFVPCGKNKADYVPNLNQDCFLIDDFSLNLLCWEESGGTGIKMLNGINGSKGTWAEKHKNKRTLCVTSTVEDVIKEIGNN